MLKYREIEGGVEVLNSNEFDINHILECGQIFRYEKTDFGYKIYSADQKVEVYCQKDTTKIFCEDKEFIKFYFDFETDYARIKQELSGDDLLSKAIEFGKGIRILNSNSFEMIISFIISANNNIPRIKKIIDSICCSYGSFKGDFYAFPTLEQLKNVTEEDFKKIGCGYRSNYLVETVKMLQNLDLKEIQSLPTAEARQKLVALKGVGRKVADCILLFGFHKKDVFPADTWIVKVYNEINNSNVGKSGATKISDWFVEKYKNLSGYAQQYMYYERLFRNKEKEKWLFKAKKLHF